MRKALTSWMSQGVQVVSYNLRFPGQLYMPETGLNYNYFRDYDPATGRFLKGDPIGLMGGINPYAYADGNPIFEADPLGLFGMDDVYGFVYNTTGGWTPSQTVVNYAAGFGDGVSLDLTNLARYLMDTNGGVDKCSTAYRAGGWTSFGLGVG